MSKRTGQSYLIKDLTNIYSELYSDATAKDNYKFVKGVVESLSLLISVCEVGDCVKLVGHGTYEICPPKKMPGEFKHFRTGKPISKKQSLPRIRFRPSPKMKELLKAAPRRRKNANNPK